MSQTLDTTSTIRNRDRLADVIADAIHAGDIKAEQIACWAGVNRTVPYAWMNGSKSIPQNRRQIIVDRLPVKWRLRYVEAVVPGVRVMLATNYTVSQLDANGDGKLTIDDAERRLLNIDGLKLNAQTTIAEGASLQRTMSAMADAADKIEHESRLIRETLQHEHLRLA